MKRLIAGALSVSLVLSSSAIPPCAASDAKKNPAPTSPALQPRVAPPISPVPSLKSGVNLGFDAPAPSHDASLQAAPASQNPAGPEPPGVLGDAADSQPPPADQNTSSLKPQKPAFEEQVLRHAKERGFAPGASPNDLAGAGEPVVTMTQLSKKKTMFQIRKEIFEIALAAHWSEWLYEIASYLDDKENDKNNVLLVTDSEDRILGFLLLGKGDHVDDARTTSYKGDIYIAYMAVRPDPNLKGVGKKLFLNAANRAKSHGENEIVLHVKKGDSAHGFYRAMSKYTPIKSEEEDTAYIAGETWIKISFNITNFSLQEASAADRSIGEEVPLLKSVRSAANFSDGSPRQSQAGPAPLSLPERKEAPTTQTPPVPKLAAPPASRALSRTALGFLSAYAAEELWTEATAFVFPLLAHAFSLGFLGMAAVAAVAVSALGLGSLLGGPLIDRVGAGKVYPVILGLRLAMAISLVYLVLPPSAGGIVLGVWFGIDYFLIGLGHVAESGIIVALYQSSLSSLNKFGAWQLRLLAGICIFGPIAIVGMTITFGLGPALMVFAAVLGLGAGIALLTVRPLRTASGGTGLDIRNIGQALRLWMSSRTLRHAALGWAVPTALVFFLYMLVGPALGLFISKTSQGALSVMAWLAGLYSAGGFFGAWYSDWHTARVQRRLDALTEVPLPQRELALKQAFLDSTRKWLIGAGLSLLGVWSLALGAPWAYALMPVLGFFATGALIQSESILKNQAPQQLTGSFLGLVRAGVMGGIALSFIPLGIILDKLSAPLAGFLVPGVGAFVVLGLVAALGSAVLLRAAHGLRPTKKIK